MREDELNILEQYDIDVKNTRKVRGAILCDAVQGLYLLKEMRFSEKRIATLDRLNELLQERGCSHIDRVLRNKEGELYSVSEEGTKYILTTWFQGRECDIRRETDVLEAVKNLTVIHKALRNSELEGVAGGEHLQQEYFRHNREMKKVRSFMRDKVGKGDFEILFLKYFEEMYEWAAKASDRLKDSKYEDLLADAKESHTLIHGDYNYHNLLMTHSGVATTNFEHAEENLQATDLYYFLRKVMEKNHWNVTLGDKILESYQRLMPLKKEELDYIAICLAYPEKFWKAANSYYRSRKVWIPAKNLEKLEMVIRQTEEKKRFLQTIFSFHL